MDSKMAGQLIGVEVHDSDPISSRPHSLMIRFARLAPAGLAMTLMLGIEGALAICVCGDGLCNSPSAEGGTCFPQETSDTCPEDCGETDRPPVQLTVRVAVVPFGDPGRFNLHVGNNTLATNVSNAQSTGPHTLPGDATLTQTAGTNTALADYRKSICGACSATGAIQPDAQSCSITNLRLPTPPPAPGCASVCLSDLLQCGAAGEESDEFCRDAFFRCNNRCDISLAGRLSIARYARPGMPSATLSEADADRIFAGMSDVLRAFDGGLDLECNVAFCRQGTIAEYAIENGIIDNEPELTAVFAVPRVVKVARAVDFCDGEIGTYNGCERGGTFIVKRVPHDSVVWAHEYGHTQGLDHRDPDDPNAVMTKGGTSASSRRVNPRECTFFRTGASMVDLSMLEPASTAVATNVTTPLPDIRTFVRQIFIHGIPYEEAMKYSPNVVPTLLDMLADPREEQAWPNIVVVLGMLGDDRAVTPLISLIEQNPEGELDYFRYEAKRNAFFALGYLANKSRNQETLSYLRDSVNPSVWAERGVTWISPERETATERDRELSRLAILALALSGDPSAEEALRELLTPAPTATESEFRAQMSAVISEALKANQRIAEEGLAKYYRESTP